MIRFPVFDRSSGENVFDWILINAEAVRQERKFWREMEYRNLIAKREADVKLSQETSKEAGQAKAGQTRPAARSAAKASA